MPVVSPDITLNNMIRLLIVDDRPAIRQGLRMCLALEPDIALVGEAGDGKTGLALAQTLRPDVVLMDIAMPGMDGITAAAALRTLVPEIAVIVHTIHDSPATRARAVNAGAAALVAKGLCPEKLVPTIREAAARRGMQKIAAADAGHHKEVKC